MNSTPYVAANLAAFVLGQWLVTRGHWSGFLVWCAANLYSIVICTRTGMPQTGVLFGAYFLVNLASLLAWAAKTRAPTAPSSSRSKPVAAIENHRIAMPRRTRRGPVGLRSP
jgi:hypothetical protein